MATFELYRRSTIGMCLTETLDEMVSNGIMSPELAIQVLVQFDKSMTEALEAQVKSKVTIKEVKFLGKNSNEICVELYSLTGLGICTPTDSVTMFGRSSYKVHHSRLRKARKLLVRLRSWHVTQSCSRNEIPQINGTVCPKKESQFIILMVAEVDKAKKMEVSQNKFQLQTLREE
ncbi:hypothetical protein TEA_001878 [Camellia sinensis var. sinensis]|uniref:Transcription initiation factor IIA gamma subunit N-terminal domain-containing protein n=1 Tax=Camellia sinensis var. sinensis TaxID=542762 RepID=A0A4S4DVE6_CAMSN|nr:hypothetical protein TEA_001878 [Camellia sinensis var. sinensis]